MAASATGTVGPGVGRRRAFGVSDRARSGTGSSRARPTLWHAIRHRHLSHATNFTAHDPAPASFARDRLYGTRSGTGSFRTRPTLRHAIRHRLLSHATHFMAHDPATDDTARDDPFLSGNVRKCPEMFGRCSDDVRLFPMMSRCRDRPAPALGVESGPTLSLSRAAERAMMKRHGHTKE